MDTTKLKEELSKYGEVVVCTPGDEAFTVLMLGVKHSMKTSQEIPKIITKHVGYIYRKTGASYFGTDTYLYTLTKKRT